eukprot:1789029-Prymnesium_polylepis.1
MDMVRVCSGSSWPGLLACGVKATATVASFDVPSRSPALWTSTGISTAVPVLSGDAVTLPLTSTARSHAAGATLVTAQVYLLPFSQSVPIRLRVRLSVCDGAEKWSFASERSRLRMAVRSSAVACTSVRQPTVSSYGARLRAVASRPAGRTLDVLVNGTAVHVALRPHMGTFVALASVKSDEQLSGGTPCSSASRLASGHVAGSSIRKPRTCTACAVEKTAGRPQLSGGSMRRSKVAAKRAVEPDM